MATFRERISRVPAILLDGALGTELNRRGVDTALPLWSAAALVHAPEVVEAIHVDYLSVGAEVITANTFRTHQRNLTAGGWGAQAQALTDRAINLARAAADRADHQVWIAGSTAPLEDCYRPDLTPDDEALAREHRQHAAFLANAGVDLILVETQPTAREAVAAARAAQKTGLPLMVSFVCGTDGRLLSGESLADAVAAVLACDPAAILVNCCPAFAVGAMLNTLRDSVGETPYGAYANVGEPDPVQGWRNTAAADPQAYAALAARWLAQGARLIGGCCGTTPEHIAALHHLR